MSNLNYLLGKYGFLGSLTLLLKVVTNKGKITILAKIGLRAKRKSVLEFSIVRDNFKWL